MAKKLLDFEDDLVGKTVSAVKTNYGCACVHFTDDTCALFAAYDEDDPGVELTGRLPSFVHVQLALGIITQEESDAAAAAADRAKEEKDRREFERLKAKFG
jgi:hypothetical protein